jgi:hypothetical protein
MKSLTLNDPVFSFYITAYNTLMDVFKEIAQRESRPSTATSTSNLHDIRPFTSRWNEMRVLADTISFKVV